jgi:hypothetical protein
MIVSFSPAAYLGIKEGDAHVIRNAGGSTYVSPTPEVPLGLTDRSTEKMPFEA